MLTPNANGSVNGATPTKRVTPTELVAGQADVAKATAEVSELIRTATVPLQNVLAEVRETIASCEAELDVKEKYSVIFDGPKTIFSVEREIHFGKDRAY
jgi:hypothetical protein